MQVCAADADGGHADEHLADTRLVEVQLVDLERPPRLEEDRGAGFH
jgi:hypothetical protein